MTSDFLPATAALCDQFPDQAKVLSWPVKPQGGRSRLMGQIVTLRVQGCNQGLIDCLSLAGDNRILLVENTAPEPNAILGDRLAQMAVTNGWQGVVLLGNIRDSAAIQTLNLGVWSLGTYPVRGKSAQSYKKDAMLSFSGYAVQSGDWLYADGDGIITASQPLHL